MKKLPAITHFSPGTCNLCKKDIGDKGYVYFPERFMLCYPCLKKIKEQNMSKNGLKMPQV